MCADADCAEVFEAYGSLEELETLACDCGCSLEWVQLSEIEQQAQRTGFELVPLG